mmetsp:Transcript_7899/g.15377  ORF Transcript_7899/g.15377 Transcript_7899/m.15377 type:complete len:405 (-) Transcript_7899:175-1389(-)
MTRIIDLKEIPHLTTQGQQTLSEKFTSVDAFLLYASKLQPNDYNSDLSSDILALEHYLCDRAKSSIIPGDVLFETIENRVHVLPTGFSSLDDTLLAGGLWQGHVTELCGQSCVGKTHFCHLATSTALLRGEHVVYIDTTNSFSIQKITRWLSNMSPNQLDSSYHSPLLDRLSLFRPHDVFELLSILHGIASDLSASPTKRSTPQLLILDSVSAVLGPVVGSNRHSHGIAMVYAVGRILRWLARDCNIAVLVTNHATRIYISNSNSNNNINPSSDFSFDNNYLTNQSFNDRLPKPSSKFKPALGDMWRSQVNVRVLIASSEDLQGRGGGKGITDRIWREDKDSDEQKVERGGGNARRWIGSRGIDERTGETFIAQLTSSSLTVLGGLLEYRINSSGYFDALSSEK